MRYRLLFACCFLSILLRAQNDSTASEQAVIGIDRNNFFYLGIDNPVTIAVSEWPCDSLVVSSHGATLKRSSPCHYTVLPAATLPVRIQVEVIDAGKRRVIGHHEFRVRKLPDPVAYVINCKDSARVSKETLVSAPSVFARMENFDFDLSPQIIGFKVDFINKNGSSTMEFTGPKLTDEWRKAVLKLQAGDQVVFRDIKAKLPRDEERMLNTVRFTIR